MKKVWRILPLAAVLGLLSSCGGGGGGGGGGGSSSNGGNGATAQSLVATATMQPSVKTLSPVDAATVTTPTSTSLEFPSTIDLKQGDVLIVNGEGMKLGALETATIGTSNRRFTREKPALIELYSSVIFNGKFFSDGKTADEGKLAHATAARAQPQAFKPKASCVAKSSSGVSTNSDSVKCDFSVEDDAYKVKLTKASTEENLKLISGSWETGIVGDFKNYDLISNSGSGDVEVFLCGDIKIQYGGELASLGTFASSAKDQICSSALPALTPKDGRIRLTTILIPVSGLPGVIGLTVPVCVAAGVKSSLSGEILSFGGKTSYKFAMGNNAAPRITQQPAAPSVTEPGNTLAWTLNSDQTGAVHPVVQVTGEIAVEASLEVVAALVNYTGLQAHLGYQLTGTAEAAAARFGKATDVAELKASYDYCAKLEHSATATATAYTSWPAFTKFFSASLGTAAKIYEYEFFKAPILQYGLCSKTSSTISINTSTQKTNAGESFTINAQVSIAPGTTGFPKDQPASGNVKIIDSATSSVLCNLALDPKTGSGSCSTFYSQEGTKSLFAQYEGDPNFLTAASTTIQHQVMPGQGHWEATYNISSCTPVPSDANGSQWIWEAPCFVYLPYSGKGGKFYFADDSLDVVFETGLSLTQPSMRRVMPLGWRSTSNTFNVSIPTGYGGLSYSSVIVDANGNRGILNVGGTGTRSFTFLVTNRNSAEIGGTFTVALTSWYFNSGFGAPYAENFASKITSAQGQWTAKLIAGTIPATQMNGHDLCSFDNTGFDESATCASPNCNPTLLLPGGIGSGVKNGCKFN